MILAIDTSLGSAVAVVDSEGVVRGEAASENSLGHAEVIGILIERALAAAAVTPADIVHVAAGMGPGPFTGLRIGIAAARAFALACGAAVVSIPSHDAAALAHLETADPLPDSAPRPFSIVTDARRREVAVSTYSGLDPDGLPLRTSGPALMARAALDEVGAESGLEVPGIMVTEIRAGALGRLAARALAAGRELAASEPLYLRAPDVTLPKAPKRVIA